MKTQIRIAKSEDATRITELYLSSRKTFLQYAPLAHTDAEVREWIEKKLIPSTMLFLAENSEGIIGILSISADESYGWIDNLYLDPNSTGHGVGTLLVEYAKRKLGAPIRLYTFQQNSRARKFYKDHGFVEIECKRSFPRNSVFRAASLILPV